MILTGPEIERQVREGRIHISPFKPENVGPNSYDVALASGLVVYDLAHPSATLDMRRPTPTQRLEIPEDGLVLRPGRLYLGATVEAAVSNHFVPLLEGRSSVGRLGISIHVTAGFGDIGWGYDGAKCLHPTWTLEITVVHPVKVYAGIRVAQVYFLKPDGDLRYYKGKYSQQKLAEPSRLHEDSR